jgi:hypothetical protein
MLSTKSETQKVEELNKPRFTSRTVTVKPGNTKSVGLGVYAAQAKKPIFALKFTPDMGELVGATLDRLDIPGKPKYMLLYQFRNNGDRDCTIEVRQQT